VFFGIPSSILTCSLVYLQASEGLSFPPYKQELAGKKVVPAVLSADLTISHRKVKQS